MTVQGSALSPGVFAPSGIHLPSKRRCPKDLYKFACRILADILTSGRCGGWPVASVVARYVSAAASLRTTALPNFILTRSRGSTLHEIREATEMNEPFAASRRSHTTFTRIRNKSTYICIN